jgi:arginyl-tRNA synthetase
MKTTITTLIEHALNTLNAPEDIKVGVGQPKTTEFGDYSSNIAFLLAGHFKRSPRDIAAEIQAALPHSPDIRKVEIAGNGFLNFFVNTTQQNSIINTVLAQKERFGTQASNNQRICLEFVSANPTGPLHVGHGRGAALGASLANILRAAGFSVHTEYYVNDAGRQMDILTLSVWLRYLDLDGRETPFPINGYQGDYIWDIAAYLHLKFESRFRIEPDVLFDDALPDEAADSERFIDALIASAKRHLKRDYDSILSTAVDQILDNIRQDLSTFGIEFDQWFSEKSLGETITDTLATLEQQGKIYLENGAKWFKSTEYGDEKNRVVMRDNGLVTYFASDIAYHNNKFARQFDTLINIWGADHHGYIPRVKAGIQASGHNPEQLDIMLVQFANLYRNGEKIPMSTRSGSYVTLKELYSEVGVDAARFFYVMRKHEQQLDFDLEVAKAQTLDNPVYYVQYAHARVYSMLRKLEEKKLVWNPEVADLQRLDSEHETQLIALLIQYADVIQRAANNMVPHSIANYLRDIAAAFHSYYNASAVIVEDPAVRNARLNLAVATAQVIRNGLGLLGVSAPESM